MEKGPSRKLAVILHADVVGSTALVRLNETIAHQRIRDAFRRFAEIVSSHDGTAHEIRGDAMVAEFARASDAVAASVEFQAANVSRNQDLSDEIRPVVRVGIAMGEVVVADSTVTGEGVILVQRLEQLADPGGVCIQDAAYQTVPKRLPFQYESLGEQEVKGFEEPVRAYRLVLETGAPKHLPDTRIDTVRSRKVWRRVAGGVVALFIVVGGWIAWWQPWQSQVEPASVERIAIPLSDKPSVAVLPFVNMSNDPEQEYFSDGITEDLITDLSKLRGLMVIARNSTFAYKGKAIDVRQIGKELGVRHVLEGSVRKGDSTFKGGIRGVLVGRNVAGVCLEGG
jgi:adenylate cyclase